MPAYSLPLFPLPEVVLFPRTHLPLHVFEDRYKALMEDVLKGGRQLGICQLREGYQGEYFGSPSIYRTLTAARVLFADRRSDGCYDVLLEGVERVALREETQFDPYRIALVEPILERVEEDRRAETMDLMREVAHQAESIGPHVEEGRGRMANLVNTWRHPGVVADIIAHVLVADPYALQGILEERSPLRRLRLVAIQLRHLEAALREKGIVVERPAGE
jgi:Lon protease-like protein